MKNKNLKLALLCATVLSAEASNASSFDANLLASFTGKSVVTQQTIVQPSVVSQQNNTVSAASMVQQQQQQQKPSQASFPTTQQPFSASTVQQQTSVDLTPVTNGITALSAKTQKVETDVATVIAKLGVLDVTGQGAVTNVFASLNKISASLLNVADKNNVSALQAKFAESVLVANDAIAANAASHLSAVVALGDLRADKNAIRHTAANNLLGGHAAVVLNAGADSLYATLSAADKKVFLHVLRLIDKAYGSTLVNTFTTGTVDMTAFAAAIKTALVASDPLLVPAKFNAFQKAIEKSFEIGGVTVDPVFLTPSPVEVAARAALVAAVVVNPLHLPGTVDNNTAIRNAVAAVAEADCLKYVIDITYDLVGALADKVNSITVEATNNDSIKFAIRNALVSVGDQSFVVKTDSANAANNINLVPYGANIDAFALIGATGVAKDPFVKLLSENGWSQVEAHLGYATSSKILEVRADSLVKIGAMVDKTAGATALTAAAQAGVQVLLQSFVNSYIKKHYAFYENAFCNTTGDAFKAIAVTTISKDNYLQSVTDFENEGTISALFV